MEIEDRDLTLDDMRMEFKDLLEIYSNSTSESVVM